MLPSSLLALWPMPPFDELVEDPVKVRLKVWSHIGDRENAKQLLAILNNREAPDFALAKEPRGLSHLEVGSDLPPPITPPQKQYSPSGRRQDLKGCTRTSTSFEFERSGVPTSFITPMDYLFPMGYNSHIAAFIFNVVTNLVPVKEAGCLACGFDNMLH